MNFTKEDSLYGSGMRVVIRKSSEGEEFHRGGFNISYSQSRHVRKRYREPEKNKFFYQLKFSYRFEAP